MFSPPQDKSLGNQITELLDNALLTHTRTEYAKGRGSGMGDVSPHRIGAAYIGMECGRALAYKYFKAEKEDRESIVSPGELQRHAEAGFWTEAKTAEWLALAGFDIHTKNEETGAQYGYKAMFDNDELKFKIAGEIDGVILGGPISMGHAPYPLLWESKKATDKKFKKFEKDGVKKADIKYYGQLQNNMTYLDVKHTLFSMLNLDTMKYYWEVVDYDPKFAQALQDRAANVIAAKSPEEIPRITADKSDYRCKFCDYFEQCWNPQPIAVVVPEQPLWKKPTIDNVKSIFPF